MNFKAVEVILPSAFFFFSYLQHNCLQPWNENEFHAL
jgi:hypothetical protein